MERVKRREHSKRIDKVTGSKDKIDTGKKMMREGQRELKRMADTGTAFKFKSGTTRQKTFAVEPGKNPKQEYKGLVEERNKASKKIFKTGKQLRDKKAAGGTAQKAKKIAELAKRLRENKMGGGMMGRRFGYEKRFR